MATCAGCSSVGNALSIEHDIDGPHDLCVRRHHRDSIREDGCNKKVRGNVADAVANCVLIIGTDLVYALEDPKNE